MKKIKSPLSLHTLFYMFSLILPYNRRIPTVILLSLACYFKKLWKIPIHPAYSIRHTIRQIRVLALGSLFWTAFQRLVCNLLLILLLLCCCWTWVVFPKISLGITLAVFTWNNGHHSQKGLNTFHGPCSTVLCCTLV